MGIERRQPGAAKAAATAGVVIGKAGREKEDRARVERQQARADAEAAQKKARQVAMDWELQKLTITSQRAFERELRVEDYRLLAEDRAAEGAIERIEFSKDLDFQYKEKERTRKISEFDNQITAMNKAADDGQIDRNDFAWQDKMTQLEAQRNSVLTGIQYREPRAPTLLEQMERRGATGQAAGVGDEPQPLTDVGGFPLPIPTPSTLTAQHVHASKVQQGKAFVIDKHTNALVQVPTENEAELLELARYEKPTIVGAPVTKPRRTRTGEMDPTGMIEAFDAMKPTVFKF
jgi:hypothetical protein